MSQIDLSSYSAIIIWSSFVFIFGYLFIYSFILPNFIALLQIKSKVKNISLLKSLQILIILKNLDTFILLSELKKLIEKK